MPQFFEWLRFFDDLPLVTVLAAHAVAETSLSERDCAARTRLNRETVHKKKRQLIDECRVLIPEGNASGLGRRGLPCFVDWARLAQLVENSAGIAGKPAIEPAGIAGKPAIEPAGIAGKPAIETPLYKERAPAPASSEAKELSSKELAVKNQQLEEAIRECVGRSRLTQLAGRKLEGDTMRNLRASLQRLTDDWQVRDVLDILEEKCRQLASHPSNKTWGWIVRATQNEVNARVGEPSQRKPPEREEAFDIHGAVKTAAATMGGRR